MYYAGFDSGGNAVMWFDTSNGVPTVPVESLVEVSQDQYAARFSGKWQLVNGAVAQAPAPTAAEQLSAAQATQVALVDAACQSTIYAGFTSSALGMPYTYPAKATDQQNLSASVLASLLPGASSGWTTDFWCADAAGNWALRAHTAAQIQQVGVDGKAAISTAIAKKVQLESQIAAATTIAAVQAIVWS